MPHIQAFRGLRYNLARVGSLSDVIAPPYDVIDGELQESLYEKSPHNVIRLELNQAQPGDDPAASVYQRAAQHLRDWIAESVLQPEPDPALYVYHQEFEVEQQRFVRRGFMARVRLQRFGEGNIYPHEQTHASAKEDRLRLTRACRANLSQIFGLYPDRNNEVQNLLEAATVGQTALEATDHLGVIHRLWPVTDVHAIASVSAAIDQAPMFVADGHHRYETACNYLDELLASRPDLPPDHPARFVMTQLVSMDDPGLVVLPTHRLLHGIRSWTVEQLHWAVNPYFDCQVVGHGPEAAGSVWAQMSQLDAQEVMALYSQASNSWLMLNARETAAERMAELAPQQSKQWRALGVSLLHRLVIDDLLGMPDIPKPTYVHQVSEVVAGLSGQLEGPKEYPLAALVMPATIEHIRQVSLNQERMPAKSTYFYPKLVSGLVIHSLERS